jgi:hypothetical protein
MLSQRQPWYVGTASTQSGSCLFDLNISQALIDMVNRYFDFFQLSFVSLNCSSFLVAGARFGGGKASSKVDTPDSVDLHLSPLSSR